MTLIDGRAIGAAIREAVAAEVAGGAQPTLALLVATDDPGTAWYAGSVVKAAEGVGIATRRVEATTAAEVVARLDELSADTEVDGIICFAPLPEGLALAEAAQHIAPAKDVDGANPETLGRLAAGLPAFAPPTAEAVVEILRHEQVPLVGADVVVVGRSTVVGKPAALLLLAENATVTVCHSRTRDLAEVTRRADVVVAAVGQIGLIGAEHVRPGAVVIDVGTNEAEDGSMVGDVDTAAVEPIASVTPVPGGVGQVTTAILLRNVAAAARHAVA